MPRLRTVSPKDPGWTRRRAGKGFVYLDQLGNRLSDEDAERCKLLVIPPAWTQVWICAAPNGHLQAVGTDDAGRRQYIYHEEWRRKRDESKHDRVLEVAAKLPKARRLVSQHLQLDGMPYERALGTAFRLLDLGFFRIGGETYAESNNSFGLATITKEHVSLEGFSVVFDYVAKSGKQRYIALADELVLAAVTDLKRRRSGGPDLLAYRDGHRWRDVTSSDINEYIKDVVGGEVSAKDFRTWHGTVIAAVALAAANDKATTDPARRRAVAKAMKEVSTYLGNTPSVARASYVDPRVVDLFNDGATISPKLASLDQDLSDGATHGRIEKAVLGLLRTPPSKVRAAKAKQVS
ncbi:MAG: DNA topoisomerase IB (poxvirus type) [uncultured Propionibacteriaceae bacterium]|uniref:DNA topoisomerase n=1 Tax=uncultured Propionibacteriaceae bacterium TaxID=257457 RepID=A0A6J4N7B4_9ACTN|nr:MAG: DNA topoisomerase IB (poxvirus type) [uncultured Propionibacteriaceae bacterium]